MSDAVVLGRYTRINEEQLALIKRQIMPPNSTNDELELFRYQCDRTGLDPFARQIYAIKRGGKLSIEPSIDGFRLVSERSGKYRGMLGPYWCGPDGLWVEVWLHANPPAAAKVGIIHRDFAEPVWSVATYAAYQVPSNPQWKTNAPNQLGLCAERQARRKAFPMELSGLYGGEEMEQVDRDQDLTPALEASLEQVKARKAGKAEKVAPAGSGVAYDAKGWDALKNRKTYSGPEKGCPPIEVEVDAMGGEAEAPVTVGGVSGPDAEPPVSIFAPAVPGHCTLKGCKGEIEIFKSRSEANQGREYWACVKGQQLRDQALMDGSDERTAAIIASAHFRQWVE